MEINLCIIFVNTRETVDSLAAFLLKSGIDALKIHGKMTPKERAENLETFVSKTKSRYLISSDLLSRGIDVTGMNLVFNYDLPKKRETYIHRMGRTGRNGELGVTINFVTETDA
jgi:translation initiation factor 4A